MTIKIRQKPSIREVTISELHRLIGSGEVKVKDRFRIIRDQHPTTEEVVYKVYESDSMPIIETMVLWMENYNPLAYENVIERRYCPSDHSIIGVYRRGTRPHHNLLDQLPEATTR